MMIDSFYCSHEVQQGLNGERAADHAVAKRHLGSALEKIARQVQKLPIGSVKEYNFALIKDQKCKEFLRVVVIRNDPKISHHPETLAVVMTAFYVPNEQMKKRHYLSDDASWNQFVDKHVKKLQI